MAQAMGAGIATQGWLANALLESFIVHVRAVMDFLYNDNAKPDDIMAQDFFASRDAWVSVRPKLSDLLRKAKKRTGKEVSHLTYARLEVAPDTKRWAFVEIANEVGSVIQVFLKNVQKEKLGPQWRATITP